MSSPLTCPSCGKTFSASMRACPFCGAEYRPEAPETPPKCPRCGVNLEPREYRGTTINRCRTCEGLWLDIGVFKRLTSPRDTITDADIPFEFERPRLPDASGYITCPACGKLMVRQQFKGISGVLIDICRDHGVWLDAGELQTIRAFVANGGLDAVRDRDIEANRLAIDSLDTRLSDVEFMQKLLHHWKAKRWVFSK